MKRPEKKKELGIMSLEDVMEVRGYNRACNDYNMFLPSDGEIRDIIQEIGYSKSGEYLGIDMDDFERRVDKATKAIAKRLGVK